MSGEVFACWSKIGAAGDASCSLLPLYVSCANCPEFSRRGRSLLDREPTANDLRDWSALLARRKSVKGERGQAVCVFSIAGQKLGLPAVNMQRAFEYSHVHTVPFRSNRIFLGLANFEGELLPCADLGALLDLDEPDRKPETRQMLVIQFPDGRWVIPVEKVHVVIRISREQVLAAPDTLGHAGYAKGVFQLDKGPVTLLSFKLVAKALARSLSS